MRMPAGPSAREMGGIRYFSHRSAVSPAAPGTFMPPAPSMPSKGGWKSGSFCTDSGMPEKSMPTPQTSVHRSEEAMEATSSFREHFPSYTSRKVRPSRSRRMGFGGRA